MTSTEKMAVIEQIALASGLNDKARILAMHPELQGVLKVCYHPHIHFRVKPTASWITGIGTGVFDENTQRLLNDLASGKLSGNAAKRHVMDEFARLDLRSQTLLMRILNKDMRCGMQAKTINKVFPDLIPAFPVQLAKPYTEGKMQFPCLASLKIDGLRCIYENGKLYSRKGKAFVGLDHIAELIKANCPDDCRVDGEIVVPGKAFDDVSGDIRAFKKSDNAVYMVFDVYNIGSTIPLASRLPFIEYLCTSINNPAVREIPHVAVASEKEMYASYCDALDLGYEGLVIKNPKGLPYDGRNWDWQKVKPQDTVDLKVEAWEEGTGKYENAVGALVCTFHGEQVRVGGGLSDAQRFAWAQDPDMIIGKIIEVEFMELSKNGRLRHPRLKCVRGDLS